MTYIASGKHGTRRVKMLASVLVAAATLMAVGAAMSLTSSGLVFAQAGDSSR